MVVFLLSKYNFIEEISDMLLCFINIQLILTMALNKKQ